MPTTPTKNRADRRKPLVTFNADPAWIEWVDGLADHVGLARSDLIDQALRRYATQIRHEVKPPRR